MRQVLEGKGTEEGKTAHVFSFVQGAALSGLTSMVLEPRHCAHLDPVLLGLLRGLSGGVARQTWRGTRLKKAKNVFRSWALLQAADELLQVRRVRWYQSWARYPKDHHAVVTAVLGTCGVVGVVGVRHLTSEGNVCLSSTPMARQMADDIRKMSHLSEEVGEWYAQRTSDAAIFTPGCWERVRFLVFPVEELPEAKMAYCFPQSEQEETEEIDGRLIELEEPFVRDENEGEEKCNERFANYIQLVAHKT